VAPARSAPLSAHRFVLGPGQPSRRLLVVDDNALNRKLLRQILENMGFEVEESPSGEEALRLFEEWRPELIWMDVRMDRMDGHAATRELRRREAERSLPRTPVITLTASAMEDDRAASIAAGADDVVAKPFRIATIASVLARHLGVRFVPAGEQFGGVAAPLGASAATTVREGPATSLGSLAHLPPEWTSDLHGAIRRGDVQAAYRVVDRIRERDAEAADGLQTMIRAYRFEEVLALTGRH
jgi:two-component system sensor histidine kinase/response regulator